MGGYFSFLSRDEKASGDYELRNKQILGSELLDNLPTKKLCNLSNAMNTKLKVQGSVFMDDWVTTRLQYEINLTKDLIIGDGCDIEINSDVLTEGDVIIGTDAKVVVKGKIKANNIVVRGSSILSAETIECVNSLTLVSGSRVLTNSLLVTESVYIGDYSHLAIPEDNEASIIAKRIFISNYATVTSCIIQVNSLETSYSSSVKASKLTIQGSDLVYMRLGKKNILRLNELAVSGNVLVGEKTELYIERIITAEDTVTIGYGAIVQVKGVCFVDSLNLQPFASASIQCLNVTYHVYLHNGAIMIIYDHLEVGTKITLDNSSMSYISKIAKSKNYTNHINLERVRKTGSTLSVFGDMVIQGNLGIQICFESTAIIKGNMYINDDNKEETMKYIKNKSLKVAGTLYSRCDMIDYYIKV